MKAYKLYKCRDGKVLRRKLNQYLAYCLKYDLLDNLLDDLQNNECALEKKLRNA